MFGELGRKIRFWALVSLCVSDVLFIGLLLIFKVFIWAFFVIGVTALVGIFEGLWFCLEKKTISTEYKLFAIENKLWAYLGLFFFSIVFLSLITHLAIW